MKIKSVMIHDKPGDPPNSVRNYQLIEACDSPPRSLNVHYSKVDSGLKTDYLAHYMFSHTDKYGEHHYTPYNSSSHRFIRE